MTTIISKVIAALIRPLSMKGLMTKMTKTMMTTMEITPTTMTAVGTIDNNSSSNMSQHVILRFRKNLLPAHHGRLKLQELPAEFDFLPRHRKFVVTNEPVVIYFPNYSTAVTNCKRCWMNRSKNESNPRRHRLRDSQIHEYTVHKPITSNDHCI